MELELTPENNDVSVTVSFEQLSDELGTQYILGGDEYVSDYAYLAGIALETCESDHSIGEVLTEFIRNSSFGQELSVDELEEVEEILR